jgi:elongation factor G
MKGTCNDGRVIALLGPAGAGKTSLAEALLFATGTIDRQGSVAAGTSVGDASAEGRARLDRTQPDALRLSG